jgi:hypothetical protein
VDQAGEAGELAMLLAGMPGALVNLGLNPASSKSSSTRERGDRCHVGATVQDASLRRQGLDPRVSYPILRPKPNNHRTCAQEHLFHTSSILIYG